MREMRRARTLLVLPVLMTAIAVAAPSAASAQTGSTPPKVVKPALPVGTITTTYKVPLSIKPGQNLNLYDYIKADQRPSEAGWIVGFTPNLKLADGSTPPVDQIHLHHLVMLINSDIVVASGEEDAGAAAERFRLPLSTELPDVTQPYDSQPHRHAGKGGL